METWITGGLALLVGLGVGFKLGRRRMYHIIGTVNYDCSNKEITSEIRDPSPYPKRIYGYAWPQGSPPANAALYPPLDAACIIWHPNTTGSFTLQDDSWPSTGSVDYRVWTVDVYNTEQGLTENCGATTTTTTTTTTSTTTTPTTTTSTTSSTTTPTTTTSTTPTTTTSTTSSTTTPTTTTSTTSSTTTPTTTTSTTSSTTTPPP